MLRNMYSLAPGGDNRTPGSVRTAQDTMQKAKTSEEMLSVVQPFVSCLTPALGLIKIDPLFCTGISQTGRCSATPKWW